MNAGLRAGTLIKIRAETERALRKHGLTLSALSPSLSDIDKLPILGEEFGEVCRALTHDEGGDLVHLMDELIQVASVAAGWAQAIGDRLELNEFLLRQTGCMSHDDTVVVISET